MKWHQHNDEWYSGYHGYYKGGYEVRRFGGLGWIVRLHRPTEESKFIGAFPTLDEGKAAAEMDGLAYVQTN